MADSQQTFAQNESLEKLVDSIAEAGITIQPHWLPSLLRLQSQELDLIRLLVAEASASGYRRCVDLFELTDRQPPARTKN